MIFERTKSMGSRRTAVIEFGHAYGKSSVVADNIAHEEQGMGLGGEWAKWPKATPERGRCATVGAITRQVIDDWASATQLPERLPRCGGVSTWWKARFAVWEALGEALPNMETLAQARNSHGRMDEVICQGSPFPWWPALIACYFPEARVRVRMRKPGPRSPARAAGIRMARMAVGYKRLASLCRRPSASPRVLVISKDMFWDGNSDIALHGIVTALSAQRLTPVVMADFFGTTEQLSRALWTRPDSHIFADVLFPFNAIAALTGPRISLPMFPAGMFRLHKQDFTPFVRGVIEPLVRHLCLSTEIVTGAVQRLIERARIQAVVTTGEFWLDERVKEAFRASGIPLIAVQNGVIYDDFAAYVYPRDAQVPLPELTCVYSEEVKRLLVERSIYESARIAVTGPVRLDRDHGGAGSGGLADGRGERFRVLARAAGCDRLLLFSSQDSHWAYVHQFLQAFRAANARNFLLVRLHPRERDAAQWTHLLAIYGVAGRSHVGRDGSLQEMLAACDAHVSMTSTTLVEATLGGRPSLIVGSAELGDLNGCLRAGVAAALESYPSLDAACEQFVFAPREQWRRAQAEYIRRHFFALDGKAAERISTEVVKLIATRCGERDYSSNCLDGN